MAVKEPQVWRDIKLCDHMTFAMLSAITADFGNPIHHQHGWRRQLCIPGPKQFAARAFQQVFTVEAGWKVGHKVYFPVLFQYLPIPLAPVSHVLQAFVTCHMGIA
jgi:hypothetical protein